MANYAVFVQYGDEVDYTPATDIGAGTVVAQGDLIGVTKKPYKAGELGAIAVEGVFDFPKTAGTGSGIAAGTTVYWDPVNTVATAATNNGATPPVAYTLIGKVVSAAADADVTVRVRLYQ